MASRKEILRPVDPFVREPVWFSARSDDFSLFTIRPLCLLGDLTVLYDWVGAARKKGSLNHQLSQAPLIQHYKALLESADSQSFLIEMNSKPVCQLDISPSQHEEVHLSFFTLADDYFVNYILDYRKYENPEFADVLKFFISFYYSSAGSGSLYILIKNSEIMHNRQVIEAGFQFCSEISLNQDTLNLYRNK